MSKATNNTTIALGTEVRFAKDGLVYTVVAYTKGWYQLQGADDTGVYEAKARAKDLKPIGGGRRMAEVMAQHKPKYQHTMSYAGNSSMNNGDDVAALLERLDPKEACHKAEDLLGLERGELVAKYEKLNPGQMRMNAGNRIRAAVKRGDLEL